MSTAEALQSLLGSLAVIVALIVQSYVARKFGARTAEKLEKKIDVVHEVVNGNHEAALARIDQLTDKLVAEQVEIPPHPPSTPSVQPEAT